MHLAELRLRDFRNFADQRISLPPEGAAIVGDNGQGKTNLLEAIYYLEVFRSFRGAPDDQLVRFGEEVFRLDARLRGEGGEVEIGAGYQRRGRKKKVTLDDLEVERLSDAVGRVGVVIFSPADLEIVSGPPGARRRLLDIVLSLSEPGYLGSLQRYRQILSQRNALLRDGASASTVAAWNAGLVRDGARLLTARLRWVADRAEAFAAHYARVAGGETGAMTYTSTVPLPGEVEGGIADAFARALEERRESEARRGTTVVGPHRDDLSLTFQERELRAYGSGGQRRTAAIALRMVEAETVRETRGKEPIFLLDDVFAELDPSRAARILAWIDAESRGQVIVTAPKPTDVDLRGGTLPRFGISSGVLSPL